MSHWTSGDPSLPDGSWHGPMADGQWGRRRGRVRGRWRHHPARGSLRRDPDAGLGGGLAAGIAQWRGLNVTTVRIVFALFTLITSGTGLVLYVGGWLFMPAKDEDASIASKARSDSLGMAFAAGVASLLVIALLILGAVHDGWLGNWGWPLAFSAAGLVLVWRNASAQEQARLWRIVGPFEGAAPTGGRRSIARVAIAAVMLIAGAGWIVSTRASLAMLRPLGGGLLMLAGVVLLLGPWWLRIARDLVLERQARVRAEERAEIAARVHDSVLQTLALIQRRAADPQQVVKLARSQERELRSWLFEGKEPGSVTETTFADAIREIQTDVEDRYGVPVEVVMVGDCELDERVSAVLSAAREATVNAAKWSGANVISVFAEVEPAQVSVVVRDKGKGFDPATVSPDRKGLAESVRGRMARHGGTATVVSAPGEGTKVTVTVPREVVAA